MKQKTLRVDAHTRAKGNHVANDRAQRENVPRHILCSFMGNAFYDNMKKMRDAATIRVFHVYK